MVEFLKKIKGIRIIQFALIVGAVILASQNKDGWGWLLFLLFITLND